MLGLSIRITIFLLYELHINNTLEKQNISMITKRMKL